MSKYSSEFALRISAADTRAAILRAISLGDWSVDGDEPGRIKVNESAKKAHWAVHVDVEWDSVSESLTRLRLSGKTMGVGPIQSRHVRGRVGALRAGIEAASLDIGRPAPPAEVTSTGIYCSECGAPNMANSSFCSSCGKPIARPAGR